MMWASSGAKSAAIQDGRLSAMCFSSRSSPVPPAGRAAQAAVAQVALALATEVK